MRINKRTSNKISPEQIYDRLLDHLIFEELNLHDAERHEAECLALAWLLKTKLYLFSETSRKFDQNILLKLHQEIEAINEFSAGLIA